jgi:hypothetical protein
MIGFPRPFNPVISDKRTYKLALTETGAAFQYVHTCRSRDSLPEHITFSLERLSGKNSASMCGTYKKTSCSCKKFPCRLSSRGPCDGWIGTPIVLCLLLRNERCSVNSAEGYFYTHWVDVEVLSAMQNTMWVFTRSVISFGSVCLTVPLGPKRQRPGHCIGRHPH